MSKHDCNPIFILTCSSDCNLTLTLTVTLNLILTQMGAAELRNNRPAGVWQRAFLYREAVCMDIVFPSSQFKGDTCNLFLMSKSV